MTRSAITCRLTSTAYAVRPGDARGASCKDLAAAIEAPPTGSGRTAKRLPMTLPWPHWALMLMRSPRSAAGGRGWVRELGEPEDHYEETTRI